MIFIGEGTGRFNFKAVFGPFKRKKEGFNRSFFLFNHQAGFRFFGKIGGTAVGRKIEVEGFHTRTEIDIDVLAFGGGFTGEEQECVKES